MKNDPNQPLPTIEELEEVASLQRHERQLLVLKKAIDILEMVGHWQTDEKSLGYVNGMIEAYRMLTGEKMEFLYQIPPNEYSLLMDSNQETVKGKMPS